MYGRFKHLQVTASIAVLTLVPGLARAQGVPGLNQNPDDLTLDDVVNVLVYLIEFGLAFAAATGMIFIVTSGYQYVLSAGNPEKVEKAKQGLTWAITGFILSISAVAIVYLLQQTLLSRNKVTNQLGNVNGPDTAAQVIEALIQIGLTFGGAVAVLFLILGGYRYITSQGNQQQVEGAKNTILYSMIGLVVVFLAFLIFTLIADIIKVR